MALDKTQLTAFVDYMIGWRAVGVAADEEISQPICPEMRAFLTALLGDAMPPYARYLVPANRGTHQHVEWEPKSKAFAALLREVADGLDPAPEGERS